MHTAWMAAAAALAAALGTTPAAATAAAPPAPLALTDCRLEHPLRLNSVAARCGVLSVAEDPGQAAGRRIGLAVAVVPALDAASHAAPLFILAGGPGQAASDLYVETAPAFARIHRTRDIVLVDQRGTGRSAPLPCTEAQDYEDAADALPKFLAATRACLAKYGPGVRFYTSSVAVRDLDAVRAALGYARVDLYGSSYGTRMAELYMRRFAERTEAVILDGVLDPEVALGPGTPLDGERALELIFARCRAQAACERAFPQLAAEYALLRQRFGAERRHLTLVDPTRGTPLALYFDRAQLAGALRFLSYASDQAALLPTLVHQAAAGDLAPLAAQSVMTSRLVEGQLALGMQLSVTCSEDVPYYHLTPAERARLEGTYLGTQQIDALEEACREWPRGPVDADLHAALASAVPTLLLSGEADPVTPPAGAARVASGLRHARHLVLPGEGHGQLATDCVPRLMAAFLEQRDPAALDASCLAGHRPAPFFVAPTGPAP